MNKLSLQTNTNDKWQVLKARTYVCQLPFGMHILFPSQVVQWHIYTWGIYVFLAAIYMLHMFVFLACIYRLPTCASSSTVPCVALHVLSSIDYSLVHGFTHACTWLVAELQRNNKLTMVRLDQQLISSRTSTLEKPMGMILYKASYLCEIFR